MPAFLRGFLNFFCQFLNKIRRRDFISLGKSKTDDDAYNSQDTEDSHNRKSMILARIYDIIRKRYGNTADNHRKASSDDSDLSRIYLKYIYFQENVLSCDDETDYKENY